MINVDLQKLIQALDAETRRDLESSAERCVARGGSKILIEDLLLGLLEHPQGLLARALQDAEVDAGEFSAVLQSRVEHSASRNPVFAPELVQWLQDALLVANLELGQTQVEQAALILALLRNPMRYAGSRYQPLLAKLNVDRLKEFALSRKEPSDAGKPTGSSELLLQRFTHNLTQQARDGKLDPVLCRDGSIRQMVDILARRRKNNPIVVGEAGVGKTAIVEGLASRIAAGEVPQVLKGVELLSLDMGLLQAGASVKGEFERRLKGVIDEVKASPRPIILFIDEAHTLIGAGNQAGGADAANLLKPALARGELRTIAATTWSEYKQYFERDAALERRFQMVKVDEPDDASACLMLRGLKARYASHHGVHIQDAAVQAAVSLSRRYLSGRQLPDKAVDLLDTASARVRMSLDCEPQALVRLKARQAALDLERQALQADQLLIGHSAEERLAIIAVQHAELESQHIELARQYRLELDLTHQLLEERQAQSPRPDNCAVLQQRLSEIQGNQPLLCLDVCARSVAEVIADWTGVPLGSLLKDEQASLLALERQLAERVIGQEHALTALAQRLRAAKTGLSEEQAPLGVFLLVGTSGVGKTETALALADCLFGGEKSLITLNLSEYQEAHTVSQLTGSPPGYVGYGQGGVLTEAVRQRPYSVVLLDEVEKAHRDVLNLFYQVFDRGFMRDGEGREIDFRNTVILMTSNLGSDELQARLQQQPEATDNTLHEWLRPILREHFQPALLARFQTLIYRPLQAEALKRIVVLKLARLARRLQRHYGLTCQIDDVLSDALVAACLLPDSGARNIDSLLNQQILPVLSQQLLQRQAAQLKTLSVTLGYNDEEGITLQFADALEAAHPAAVGA